MTTKPPRQIFGLRVKALIEAIALLSFIFLLDQLFDKGDRFMEHYPHPFWIPVLLVTAQYGTSEGLATAVLATLFLYVGNIPGQLVDESAFDYQYRMALRPFLWFATVFVLGELRMRLQQQIDELTEGRDRAVTHAQAITSNYEALKAMKENLEARLAGQVSTVSTAYETVRGLESLKPVQILMSLDNIVHTTLNPRKFSVFAAGPNGLEATTAQGWAAEDPLLRRFPCDHPLYIEVVEKKRVVCLVNQVDEKILADQGVIAGPLIERSSGTVFGMIKVEEIDFFKLDIGNMETFKTLCELVGSAYSNAIKYKMAMANAIYEEEVGVFSGRLYELLEKYLTDLCSNTGIPLALLSIRMQQSDTVVEDERSMIAAIYALLIRLMPEGTAVFQGKEKVMYQMLLSNTTAQAAEQLSISILDAIQKDPLLADYRFILHTESLYEPKERGAKTL